MQKKVSNVTKNDKTFANLQKKKKKQKKKLTFNCRRVLKWEELFSFKGLLREKEREIQYQRQRVKQNKEGRQRKQEMFIYMVFEYSDRQYNKNFIRICCCCWQINNNKSQKKHTKTTEFQLNTKMAARFTTRKWQKEESEWVRE